MQAMKSSSTDSVALRSSRAFAIPVGVDALILIPGALAFSPWRVNWFAHTLIPGGDRLRVALVMPCAIIAAACLFSFARRPSHPDISSVSRRGGLETVALGLALLIAVMQWASPSNQIALLYAWIAAAAVLISRRALGLSALKLTGRTAVLLLGAAVAGMTWLHVDMQLSSWRELSFGYPDIGHFARALHSVVHGRGVWVDSLDCQLFGDHAFFAILLFAPFCLLGMEPFHLLVIASPLLLNGSSLIIYWFARKKGLTPTPSLVIALAWLLLPMHGCLVYSKGYGFHEAQVAVPLLVAGLAFTELGWIRRAVMMMLLTLLVREDLTLTVAAWACYLFAFKQRRVTGAVMLAVSVGYFFLMIKVVIPWFRGAPYPHMQFHFENNAPADPVRAILINASFIAMLTLPVAGLCFRQWRLLLAAVPAVAEAMMSRNLDVHNIAFHYYIPAIPGIFMAAVMACIDQRPHPLRLAEEQSPETGTSTRTRSTAAIWGRILALFTASWLTQSFLSQGAWTHQRPGLIASPRLAAAYPQIRAIHDIVLPGRTVTASYLIASQFIDADRLWMNGDEVLADAIIIEDSDQMQNHNPRDLLARAVRTGEYDPIYADYHMVAIMKRAGQHSIAPAITGSANPLKGTIEPFDMGEGIQLVGLSCSTLADGSVRVSLVWQGDGSCGRDVRFGLTVGDHRRWGPFYFARGAYPAGAWEAGRYYYDEIVLEPSDNAGPVCADLQFVLLQ